jgi:hypothetical protein
MFKPFCWESNDCWGNVDTAKDWAWMRLKMRSYPQELIYGAKSLPGTESASIPSFGSYAEYVGKITLLEWAGENALDLHSLFKNPFNSHRLSAKYEIGDFVKFKPKNPSYFLKSLSPISEDLTSIDFLNGVILGEMYERCYTVMDEVRRHWFVSEKCILEKIGEDNAPA